MKVKMFQGRYFNSYLQFLSSNGGKALRKEVMPGYLLIVALILIFLYMEKPPQNICMNFILALLGLPVLAIALNFVLFSARAFAASKRYLKVENGIITVMNIVGSFKREFSDMHIRYFVGSYIDFIDKGNLLNGYALFGDKDFLERVIFVLKENGFNVILYPALVSR